MAKPPTPSPFDWQGQPSTITKGDRSFTPCKDGGSLSHNATRQVHERTAKTGKNPGTMTGISRAERASQPLYAKRSGVQ